MSQIKKTSYYIFFGILFVVGYMKLATPLITVLFGYLALSRLKIAGKNWIAITLFIILLSGLFYGFYRFVREAVTALPQVAENSVPVIIRTTSDWGIELPFSDIPGLKTAAKTFVNEQIGELAKFTQIVTKEFVVVLIGLVVAISVFVTKSIDLNRGSYKIENNLYSALTDELSNRFITLYQSFSTVMGAQLVISAINTLLTALFAFVVHLPLAHVVVVVTFLCGLLPVIGNLISNTLIILIALTKAPTLAVVALIYLVVLHKFEYFLNSKIIGSRIKNPMWLTLLGLIAGEQLMGIPGMILAPVFLYYLKSEGSQIPAKI